MSFLSPSFKSLKISALMLLCLMLNVTFANASVTEQEIATLKQALDSSNKQITDLKQKTEYQENIISSFELKDLGNNKEIKNEPYKDKKLSFKEGILTNTSGVNNKKHSFVSGLMDYKIMGKDISIRPYFGFGYAFNAANYLNNKYVQNQDPFSGISYQNQANGSTDANNVLPSVFNQLGGIIGFIINEKFMIEVSGYGSVVNSTNGSYWRYIYSGGNGFDGYQSSVSSSMNTFRLTFGYILDKEIFGKYADKNKLILLAGLAIGSYTSTISDFITNYGSIANPTPSSFTPTISTHTNILFSPEFGLAYQRYIMDHLSLRVDGRINMLGANGNSAINGTIMASMLFHV